MIEPFAGYQSVALLNLLLVVLLGLARLRAIQRRSHSPADEPFFHAGQLAIDFTNHAVTLKGDEVKLTPTEYALLKILAQHAGRIVSHQQLLREVWGPNAAEQSQYLRVYMTHLRKKIDSSERGEKLLRTESGIGYRLVIPTTENQKKF